MNEPTRERQLQHRIPEARLPDNVLVTQPPVHPLAMTMFLIGSAEVVAGPMMADMGRYFSVPAAQIAWLPAIYAVVYAILAIPLGPVSDRFGRRAMLVPGLAGFALSTGAIAIVPSFSFALAASAVAGLCAAVMQPNALAIVNDTVRDPTRQAAKLGQVFLGLTISFVATPVIAAFLASRLDWRAAYLLMAAIAMTAAILSARMSLPAHKHDKSSRRFGTEFLLALRVPSALPRLASSYLWIGLSVGVLAILAEILRRRYGLETEDVGLIVGLFGAAALIGNCLIGRAVDLAGSRQQLVVIGTATCAIGLFIVGVFPPTSLRVAIGVLLVWALVHGAAAPVHHGLLSGLSDSHRGTISALNASLINLGIVTVTFAAGRIFDIVAVEYVVGGAVLGTTVAFLLLAMLLNR